MSIQNKLKKLRGKLEGGDQEDFDKVALWEREYKEASLIDNLGDLAAVKMLKERLEQKLKTAEEWMSMSMPEKLNTDALDYCLKRAVTQKEIEIYNWFLGLFTTTKNTMEAVEGAIDKELE